MRSDVNHRISVYVITTNSAQHMKSGVNQIREVGYANVRNFRSVEPSHLLFAIGRNAVPVAVAKSDSVVSMADESKPYAVEKFFVRVPRRDVIDYYLLSSNAHGKPDRVELQKHEPAV